MSFLYVPADCPKCGRVPRLVDHLVREHGFGMKKSKSMAARIVNKERLSVAECRQLGIPLQAVKLTGALSHRRRTRDEVPAGLPGDAKLDRAIAEAVADGRITSGPAPAAPIPSAPLKRRGEGSSPSRRATPSTVHKARWYYPGEASGYQIRVCDGRAAVTDVVFFWQRVTCPACLTMRTAARRCACGAEIKTGHRACWNCRWRAAHPIGACRICARMEPVKCRRHGGPGRSTANHGRGTTARPNRRPLAQAVGA